MNPSSPLPDAIPFDDIRHVLVVKLRHHSDVLLTSPVFSALKRHAPHVHIDALVYSDTAAMLTLHPAINEVLTVNRNWKKLGRLGEMKKEWHLFRALRAGDYDLVIHLSEHARGAWMARLLGAQWAVGQARPGARWRDSFTHLYNQPRTTFRHTVESNLDALRRIGVQPAPEERRLTLVPGYEAEMKVAARIRELGIEPRKFIHIHPASRWIFKCWPTAHMAALIDMLQAVGHQVVLTAAPSREEKVLVEDIQSRLAKPVISLAGGLSIKDMAVLSSCARLFIGIDSAPLHIAAAMRTPVVALFGPTSDLQWGPWGVPSRIIKSQHSCRPCGIDGCGGGKVSDCLVSLRPESVFAAVNDLLRATESWKPDVGKAAPASPNPSWMDHLEDAMSWDTQ
ncbi:MAG: putative lipopolysaccharide heptosyltransferase III [Betaproteobacteria bacterium]